MTTPKEIGSGFRGTAMREVPNFADLPWDSDWTILPQGQQATISIDGLVCLKSPGKKEMIYKACADVELTGPIAYKTFCGPKVHHRLGALSLRLVAIVLCITAAIFAAILFAGTFISYVSGTPLDFDQFFFVLKFAAASGTIVSTAFIWEIMNWTLHPVERIFNARDFVAA
jgi:hypothetical protein